MIISVSRRTDIPARYADWFYTRLKEGYVLSRNPMRYHQVSRISLHTKAVDGIVFWTKNPAPMLDRLELLSPFPYYFQFTLTSYGKDIEPGVPSKSSEIIPIFQRLADLIGPEKVIWRYDPIMLTAKYTYAYHQEYFYAIAKRLAGYTRKCVISFLDDYKGAGARLHDCGMVCMDEPVQRNMASSLSYIARSFQMDVETCAEKIDLSSMGIKHTKCIDGGLLDKIRGYPIKYAKDRNQRADCCCNASVDIGSYNTCLNGCLYCYANHAPGLITKALQEHNPLSPMLTGHVGPDDMVTDRIR